MIFQLRSGIPLVLIVALALTSVAGTVLRAQTPVDVRKDAERGDPAAQYRLGLAYRDGIGEAKDVIEAYRWVSLAAARATAEQSAEFAVTRDRLVASMTLAQIAEAQKRARTWIEGFEPVRSASARTAIAGTPGSTLALLRGGTDIPAPQLTRQVEPGYPSIAQRARVQGNVILDVTIAPAGRVNNVQILRSIPLLDQAAIEAVKQWEFAPTVVNGVAMPVIMTVTVSFTLR